MLLKKDKMNSIWMDIEGVSQIIQSSRNRAEILQRLNRSITTTSYRRLKQFERDNNIDINHYTKPNTGGKNRSISNDELFVSNSNSSGGLVRRRVLRDRLIPYVCSSCGNTGSWMNSILSLQLEHIDGNSTNNQLDNLCFLCPNCHSQTNTYAGRNKNKNDTKPVKRTYDEYKKLKSDERYNQNIHLIELVLNSNIDFTKRGWSKRVAELINKKPQKVKSWMMLYMPNLYNKIKNKTTHNNT